MHFQFVATRLDEAARPVAPSVDSDTKSAEPAHWGYCGTIFLYFHVFVDFVRAIATSIQQKAGVSKIVDHN